MRKSSELHALSLAAISPKSPACGMASDTYLLRELSQYMTPEADSIIVSGGYVFGSWSEDSEIYSISTDSWESGPKIPGPFAFHNVSGRWVGTVISQDEVFLIGQDYVAVCPIEKFTNTSELQGLMMYGTKGPCRVGMCFACVGENIYFFGGNWRAYWAYSAHITTIKVFSMKTKSWQEEQEEPLEMLLGRAHMGAVAVEKKIYIFGGENYTTGATSRVEVIDTESHVSSELPCMSTARTEMGVALIDNRYAWILGGTNEGKELDSIEIFDVEKKEWSVSPIKMTSPRSGIQAVAVGHKIYVIGGVPNRTEVLDIDEMKWKSLAPMMKSRVHFGMTAF